MQPKHKEIKQIIFELVLVYESYEWTDSLHKSEFIMLEMINNTIIINSYLYRDRTDKTRKDDHLCNKSTRKSNKSFLNWFFSMNHMN
ncbi:MAG: hypothetical protein ACRDCH_01575 [Metamycoplasmataceae bacterium]